MEIGDLEMLRAKSEPLGSSNANLRQLLLVLDKASPGIVFLVTFFIFYPFALTGVDAHHDGVMLKPALDVLSGKVLFKETFTQYGALTTYLQALFLGIFGATLKVLKISTVFMYALSSATLFMCWRLFLPLSLSLLASLFWILLAPFYDSSFIMLPWSSVYALFFQALALYFLILTFKKEERFGIYAILSGISCALVFLCRQPVGFFTFAAIFGSLSLQLVFPVSREAGWKRGARSLAFASIGFGGILLLFLIQLKLVHAEKDWYFQTVLWPRMWLHGIAGRKVGRVLASLLTGKELGLQVLCWITAFILPLQAVRWIKRVNWIKWALLAYYSLAFTYLYRAGLDWRGLFGNFWGWVSAVPIGVCAFFLFQLAKLIYQRRQMDPMKLAAISACSICLASWLQYFPVTCVRHVFWGISPAIGIFVYAVYELSGRKAALVLLGLICFLSPFGLQKLQMAQTSFAQPASRLTGLPVLEGMNVSPAEAEDWQKLIQALSAYTQENPKMTLLLEGSDPLYAALLPNLQNPGPFFMYWGIPIPDEIERRTRFIDEYQPLLFIQITHRDFIQAAIKKYGYSRVLKIKAGELYAPAKQAHTVVSSKH
jgi:hypothetical protein